MMLSRREFLEILSHENGCINAIVFLHDWRLEETRCGVESLDSQQGGDKHNPNLCKSSATKISMERKQHDLLPIHAIKRETWWYF